MQILSLFPDKIIAVNPTITALCEDSRKVKPGCLFFAHAATNGDLKSHGVQYVDRAIMAGSVAIVVPKEATIHSNWPPHIPIIKVENTRQELSRCASLFYPHPPKHIVAVTGTSGKTSTTYFVQQLLNLAGQSAVSIGTIGVTGALTRPETLTTPIAPELHELLNDIAENSIDYVAMEASSQALDQYRMDHVVLQAAAFTNLSRDHLDYHVTMENYFSAKSRLFEMILPSSGTAVINADDLYANQLIKICSDRGQKIMTYGWKSDDLKIVQQILAHDGQTIHFVYRDQSYQFKTAIAGAFQAGNLMAALGLCLTFGLSLQTLVPLCTQLKAPPGRLQKIDGHPQGAAIYVDYAHKPDALEHVLNGLQAHQPHHLICVFGCGGDRDPGKRPLMGEIATRLAHQVIVTDDNPRSENPATIRSAILSTCKNALEIADRRIAIQMAINMAGPHDIVLIAGKGHEQGQKFLTHTDPFDDVVECQKAIQNFSSTPLPPVSLHSSYGL